MGAKFGIGEGHGAAPGAGGVDGVSGCGERAVGNFGDRAGVVGVGENAAEAAVAVGGETADAGDSSSGAATADNEYEVAVEIGVGGGDAGLRDGVADGERTGTIQFHHAHTRTVHDVENETVSNAVGGESEQAAAGSWSVGGIHLVSSRGESRSRSERRSVIYVHQ